MPAGGGSSPTFSSSKLFERLGNRRMDGVFEGELAESWKPAADFKSYTIKIRKGVKFHDGKDMTVDDVVYSIDEIWKKYAAASALTDFAGVEAPDADTVVVKFNKPIPEFFFSSLLCGNVNYIVPKHVYAGSDPVTNPANNAPIATGPWKFKEWVRGSHFEYVKNDAYWRKDMPYMDRLIIRYVRDPAGRAAAMEAGDIHIGVFNPVAPPDIKRLTATGKFVATPKGYEESVWSTTLECNMRNPIFAKREVRQAMFHAVDRNLIAKTVYYGYARPGTGPIFSPNKEFFTPDTYKTAFDPKKAAALLDAAGYPKKADGKRFTLNLLAAGWFTENGKIGAYREAGAGGCRRRHQPHGSRPADLDQAHLHRLRLRPGDLQPGQPVGAGAVDDAVLHVRRHQEGRALPQRLGLPHRRGRRAGREDQGRDRPAKRKALVVEFQKITTRRSAHPAAGRARIDHRRQHQGAEPLQRSQLPGRELVRHMAGELSQASSSRQPPLRDLLEATAKVPAAVGDRRWQQSRRQVPAHANSPR